MASVYFLIPSFDQFLENCQHFIEEADITDLIEFKAARLIQAYVKRFLVQRYIKKLNDSAVTIQRWYRGWRGRVIYHIRLKEIVEEMFNKHYNKQASIIKKIWYGFLSRRNIFSYYAMKAWLSRVQNKNEEVLQKIKDDKDAMCERKLEEFEIEAKNWVFFILSKLHHLLRTKTQAGIFSKKYTSELSEFEKMLKSIHYKKYMTNLKKIYNKLVTSKKPKNKTGKYLPVIGYSDLYWYLEDDDIEKMISLGKELKTVETPRYYAHHSKPFTPIPHLSCKERTEKLFVKSVFIGKYEKQVTSLTRDTRSDLDISPIKFYNFNKNLIITPSTLKHIDYHINVLLNLKKCSIDEKNGKGTCEKKNYEIGNSIDFFHNYFN